MKIRTKYTSSCYISVICIYIYIYYICIYIYIYAFCHVFFVFVTIESSFECIYS